MTPRPTFPNRRYLLPEQLLAIAPKPVKDAQAAALDQIERAEAARTRLMAAREAAEAAPDQDAAKLVDAARADKKFTPTQPRLEEERDAARAAYNVVVEDAEQAIKRLHRVLIEHLPKFIKAHAPELAAARDEARKARKVAAEKVAALEAQAGIAAALSGADEYRQTGTRGKRYQRLGRMSFDRVRGVDGERPDRLLRQLGSAIEQLGNPITETTGQRQDREEQERNAQSPRLGHKGQAAGRAVHVPAGNQW
jgi:hypothetical protein